MTDLDLLSGAGVVRVCSQAVRLRLASRHGRPVRASGHRCSGGQRWLAVQPPYDAVIFDMDGVVTDTAAVHARAWKALFDEVLADPRARADPSVQPFDIVEDYRRYVDGRRREDGLLAFLSSRKVDLPAGTPEDPEGAWTAYASLHARTRCSSNWLRPRAFAPSRGRLP